MKRDYYAVLEVEPNCEQDQIKIAYRKMALKLHPDKNPSEQAKQQFQEIQEAYQVLSDPNERSWYDNHKQQILNPDKNKSDFQKEEGFGFNIFYYFNANYQGFNDDQQGFYAFYREAFEKIKYEEEAAFKDKVIDSDDDDSPVEFEKLPGFRSSTTPLDLVLKFYTKWDNFVTYKSFSYADEYNPRDAPNRWVKRQIITENKKFRREEKKKYVKTIKKLVELVKYKDPRYLDYQQQLKKEQELQEIQKKKQKELDKIRDAEILKEARIQEQQRFQENEQYFKNSQFNIITEKAEKGNDVFYCDVCDKEFKSESQMKNHQNSKIHKQNVKEIIGQVTQDKQEQEELLRKAGLINSTLSELQKKEQLIKEQIQQQVEKEQQKQQYRQNLKDQKKKNKQNKKVDEKSSSEPEEQPVDKNDSQTNPTKQSEQNYESDDDTMLKQFLASKAQRSQPQTQPKQQQQQKQTSAKQNDVKINNQQNMNISAAQMKPKKNKKNKQKTQTMKNFDDDSDNEQTTQDLNDQVHSEPQLDKEVDKNEPQNNAAEYVDSDNDDFIQRKLLAKTKKQTQDVPKKTEQTIVSEVKQVEVDKQDSAKDSSEEEQEQINAPKLNKAKIKRNKKKAKAESGQVAEFKCKQCLEQFPSKTKLFSHLSTTGHQSAK